MLTLQHAIDLPQAQYLMPQEAGINNERLVSAPMNGYVITTPSSRRNIPCTKVPLEGCLGVGIENTATGELAIAHTTVLRQESLAYLFRMLRKTDEEKLEIHLIGSLKMSEPQWEKSMQATLDIINQAKNVELKTFDAGHKPHPVTFAMIRTPNGTRLVRGTDDVIDLQSYWNLTGETQRAQRTFRKNHGLEHAYQPRLLRDVEFSPQVPLWQAYDGRSDMQKQPKSSYLTP